MLARNRMAVAWAASALLMCGAANAVTLSPSGQTATVFGWGNELDGAALSGQAMFRLTSLSSTQAVFDVWVSNLTNSAQPGQNRLVSFGIGDVSPDITDATIVNDASGDSWNATRNTNFPGFQRIDLCIWAGPNCAGGSHNGLGEGESDFFTLTLTGTFTGSISLGGSSPSKWQSVGFSGESYHISGGSVPEPGPLALFAFGMACLAVRRRAITA